MTTEGIEFINASPELVTDYLEKRQITKIKINPCDLHIKTNGRHLKLGVGRSGEEYTLRSSFMKNLMKWYSFPTAVTKRMSIETTASLLNDFLLQIKDKVTVKLENDEALTITSPGYIEMSDLEIIRNLTGMGIRTISRNDYIMRITTQENYKLQPVEGDDCGAGICIINSETGFSALKVQHFVIRYICTNGAMIKIDDDNKSKIHYGSHKDSLKIFLEDQVKTAVEKRDTLKEKFKRLTETKIYGNDEVIEKVRKLLGEKNLPVAEDSTLYDLFNLLTEKAKQLDLSRRMFFEKAAGEMII